MNYNTGEQLRDAGIQAVNDNNAEWRAYALELIGGLPSDWIGTGEDIRRFINEEPKHHNAWGGLIRSALTRGLIEPTGHYAAMRLPKSHARRTAEYKKVA